MTRETIRLLADKYLGLSTHEQFVDWAISSLETGFDTKSIRILASLQKPLFPTEVENYFYRSLKELGWNLPEPKKCVIEYAYLIAEDILSGKILPVLGCHRIYDAMIFLDCPSKMAAWTYLYDEMQPEPFMYLAGKELDDAIIKEARKFIEESKIVV